MKDPGPVVGKFEARPGAGMGRELQFADQDSSRSDASSDVVHWEGQQYQYVESRHPAREIAGTWMSAMSQTP